LTRITENLNNFLLLQDHQEGTKTAQMSLELDTLRFTDLIKEGQASSSGIGKGIPREESTHEINDSLIPHDEVTYPEGGLTAYLVLFGSFMGFIPAFGMMNVIGAIESYVSSHQLSDVSSSTVSWIFSMYCFVAFAFGIFSGAFFDRCGSRRPLLIGTIGMCGGLLATAECTTVYQFILAFGVCTAMGNGMMMSPLIGVVSHYFHRKRGMAASIATNGGSVGGIVIPLMLRKLYVEVGFKWALRILSLFFFVCLLFSLIFAKERFREENDKVTGLKSFMKVYVIDCFDYESLLKKPNFLFCALAITLSESAVTVISIYFPSYATSKGVSTDTSFLLITILNASACLGRYIPGLISDVLGRFNVIIIAISVCVVLCLALWMPFGSDTHVLYAFAVLYGFFGGCVQSLPPVCTGQISRTEEFGKRYSTVYFIVSLGMLAAIPVAGSIIGEGKPQNYTNFIIYASVVNVAAVLCFAICRNICVGWKLRKF
jgi:MFS family permease